MVKLATMFGIGNVKIAPGTFGSAVAALLAYPLLILPYGWLGMMAGVLILTVVGTHAANAYMQAKRNGAGDVVHDPQPVVIDEWAGQWLTYSVFHLWLIGMSGTKQTAVALLQAVVAQPHYLFFGFVLFRFFDIFKPWPIGMVDRKVKGGFGVMLDDLVAALFAGTILFAIHFFGPLISGQLMESHV